MNYSADINNEEVIDAAASYIARGWRRTQVRRALRKRFNIDNKVDLAPYLEAGESLLRDEYIDGKDVLAFARTFFRELAADETVTDSARIRAMEKFCALHGVLGSDQSSDDIDTQQQRLREFLRETASTVPEETDALPEED